MLIFFLNISCATMSLHEKKHDFSLQIQKNLLRFGVFRYILGGPNIDPQEVALDP